MGTITASTFASKCSYLFSCQCDTDEPSGNSAGPFRALFLDTCPKDRKAAMVALGLGHCHHTSVNGGNCLLCLSLRSGRSQFFVYPPAIHSRAGRIGLSI